MEKIAIVGQGSVAKNLVNDINNQKQVIMNTAKPGKVKSNVKAWLNSAEQKEIKANSLALKERNKRWHKSFYSFQQYYRHCMSFPSYKQKGNK